MTEHVTRRGMLARDQAERASDTTAQVEAPIARISSRPIWLLTVSIAAAAVVLTVGHVADLHRIDRPISIPWPALAALFYLAEMRVVHFQFRQEAHSFTLSEIPLVLGLFLVPPPELVLACVVGAGLGLLVHRRPQPVKLAFNVALFALQAAVTVTVFSLLAVEGGPLVPQVWVATVAATLAANMLGLGAVAAAVSLVERRTPSARLLQSFRFGLAVAFTNTGLALVGVTLLSIDRGDFWLLAIPAVLVAVAYRSYRAYASERDQAESLELLFATTRILHRTTDLEEATVELLRTARQKFRAELAEIVLFPEGSDQEVLRTILGPGGVIEALTPSRLDKKADATRVAAIARREASILMRLGRRDDLDRRTERVAGRPVRDAMVAPLMGEQSIIGTMLVANRLGAVGTFRSEELRLFQTLANHAGIALENGQLGRSLQEASVQKDQMRYELEHDALTGLANRPLFIERLTRALGRHREGGAPPAVLFVDLDEFKTVNDRFGHAAGDQLLRVVADRLRGCMRGGDVAARLGGDEFAILVPAAREIDVPLLIAERIVEALRVPVRLNGHDIQARASVGIAVRTSPSETMEELLNNADVAMYTAKARGKGRFILFDPSLHGAVLERRAARAELEHAVQHEEFVLHYQPVRGLKDGTLVSVEALVRWAHPTRGLLEPRDFLSLAESSGLIVPLGRWVLETACRQAMSWGTAVGAGPTVSVNIAARQLMEPGFPDDVAAILTSTGLPGARLELEIEERLLMGDTTFVVERLTRLRELGVRLAVDDFGTGFSSLSYLGKVPLDVLKIAKPFVDTTDGRPEGSRVSEAIVALAHSLRLSVVAEGIERPDQLEELMELGCDSGQGYYFARPIDAAGMEQLLARDAATRGSGGLGTVGRAVAAPAPG